ncbi:GNAT family N-acetyltransferase [Lapidilactobacillus bayanensis]|uniref:GNAT family N-acetyltransferase n=1 Tax=Lapidilactobacillus bayanensis TaxID=2485998 RepID=UPI000F76EAF7|nr:GNAT family protein [Lapidilactobacillus bayanensis]
MQLTISQLTQANALEIADDWHYQGQYAFYNMSEDPEDYDELTTPELRQDQYFQVLNSQQKLIGFFCLMDIETSIDTYEIGLGLRPDLTGQGNGQEFLTAILQFVLRTKKPQKLILDVAEFNTRAQKLYANNGFTIEAKHQQATNHDIYPFVTMSKSY